MNPEDYLKSKEWKAKRKAVKERCQNICERCHKYSVDGVHHLTYERLYNERLEDLQGLCAGATISYTAGAGLIPCKTASLSQV
jgi:hypothetical protein